MRQSRAAGDKLFVDYAGDGVPVVIDRLTGERRAAQIAVLGASSFTYTQATWTQGLADWISGHVGAFQAIGGLPAPDNTKVAVIKACLYDPQINHSYAAMAAHYGTAILPRDRDGRATKIATSTDQRQAAPTTQQKPTASLRHLNARLRDHLCQVGQGPQGSPTEIAAVRAPRSQPESADCSISGTGASTQLRG
jgi:transposase